MKTVVICATHCIRLCTRAHERKKIFKKDGTEISDYSWLAPNPSMTCWQKAHAYYIPRGLFSEDGIGQTQNWHGTDNLRFVNASVSSDCYNKKRVAFGNTPVRRGRKTQSKNRKSKGTTLDLVSETEGANTELVVTELLTLFAQESDWEEEDLEYSPEAAA